MIQSIRIANFKSFQDATLPLASLTMLIGPNASGKSNALEAIRLLSLLAKGQRLDEITSATASNRVRGQALDMFRSKKEY
ncbi:MAG: ATP-binding protein, partial [Candidatus Cloacimonetes bacterium]|nr:ATP-binding protein [Candidatus Cloacimonadota bacterium]MCK9185418.1 ATP-binding protein [Candidatus Cloacimonadota bacterium]